MSQQILIRDLTILGEGVGSYEGCTLFVDGALPGERVEVEITEKKATYAKAKVKAFLEVSPYRIKPVCPVFGKCGGCQIMHLDYEEQLKIKQKRVIDAFERIGKLKDFSVAPCIPSPHSLYYRNKIQLPVYKGEVGLYAKRSHDIVSIKKCYIQEESMNHFLQGVRFVEELRYVLIKSNQKGELLVVLVTREKPTAKVLALAKEISQKQNVKGVLHGLNAKEGNVLFSDAYTPLFGEEVLQEEILDIQVKISPASFFQVNVPQAENLYRKAFELAALKPGERALDAYSGVGVFAIYLAKQGVQMMGMEVVSSAVEDAKKNAHANGAIVDFRWGKVEDLMGSIDPVDVIFLNPPRKGCEEKVLRAAIDKKSKKIIYTSCDPATLARDLHVFQNQGYTHIEAFPFDMFPQTMHVETVVKISAKG